VVCAGPRGILATRDTNASHHAYAVKVIEAQYRVIAKLPSGDIAEALPQPPHGFVCRISPVIGARAHAERPQVINAMRMIGMVVCPNHAINRGDSAWRAAAGADP